MSLDGTWLWHFKWESSFQLWVSTKLCRGWELELLFCLNAKYCVCGGEDFPTLSGFRYLLHQELHPSLCIAVMYCRTWFTFLRGNFFHQFMQKYYIYILVCMSPLLVCWRCIVGMLFDFQRFSWAMNDLKRWIGWLNKLSTRRLIQIKHFVCGEIKPVGLLWKWLVWTNWKHLRYKLVVSVYCPGRPLQKIVAKLKWAV